MEQPTALCVYSDLLNLPGKNACDQLMYLSNELVNNGNSNSEAFTDVILEYDYQNGIIIVYMMEVDVNKQSGMTFLGISECGQYFYHGGTNTIYQYSGQAATVGATAGTFFASNTSIEFLGNQNGGHKSNWKKRANGSLQEGLANKGRRFYMERSTKHCVFCRKNGEPQALYRTHLLRENNIITCPVLRKYVCPVCNANGDNAHTLKHCPKNKGESSIVGRHEISRSGRNARGILGKTYRYD